MTRARSEKKKKKSESPQKKRLGPTPRHALWIFLAVAGGLTLMWAYQPPVPHAQEVTRYQLEILQEYPHDPEAFTQGLLWHEGSLYESTGLRGRSSLRRVNLETGEVEERRDLEGTLFGEGLARVGDRLIQLTWQNHRALVWDLQTFSPRGEFTYRGQGWGLCRLEGRLVMSNGSHVLSFRDPESFERLGSVQVRENGRRVIRLNELECVDGQVWANIWMTDRLVRIDPETGVVTASVDASELGRRLGLNTRRDVLNGIAYNPEREVFYLTGKLWPRLFEVRFAAAGDSP